MPPAGSTYTSPYTPHQDRQPLPKIDDLDNDKHSTMSHASGVPRIEHGYGALRHVAGNRVRHARCPPEFLEEIASRGVQTSLKKSPHRRFQVISGLEARTYFKDYVRDHGQESELSSPNDTTKSLGETMPSPIVFAVTVWEENIKCVDYYMTWRGKLNVHRGKDADRHATLLDSEFRKLAKGLDKEYKAISALRNFGNLSQGTQKFEKKPSRSSSHKPRPPPGIMVSTPEEPSPKPDTTLPALPEPPASATDSVISIPTLGYMRGVPTSHLVPLRVVNPDRLSMISESSIAPEELKKVATSTTTNILQRLAVPTIIRSSKPDRPFDVHDSSASIHSTESQSTQSSKSSRSSSPSENRDDSRHPSPDGHKHRAQSQEIPDFLIVFLGDKFDNDPTSWHGLDRQVSIRSLPADRHSPWIVPLVRSESINYRSSPTVTPNDSESEGSDDEVGVNQSPVIPLKPFMEACGIMPIQTSYHSPAVIPGGLQYQYQLSIVNANSPARTPSPFLYGSPCLDASAYVPAWIPPSQIANHPPSRPASHASHAYSPASFASPYMQSHTGPF